jgi:hypothetical protein
VPACALYLALHGPRLRRAGRSVREAAALVRRALLAAGGFSCSRRASERTRLSRLEGEGGGADQYAFAQIGSIWWKTLAQCGLALLLQFHVARLRHARGAATSGAAARGRAAGALLRRPLRRRPAALPDRLLQHALLPPALPLAALAIVQGGATLPPRARRTGLVLFLVVNGATTLVFDVPWLFDRVRPALPDAKVEWLAGGPPLSLLDNLRMEQHRDQAAWLRAIDEQVEPGAALYFLDVVYYRDAQQTVFERDGFLRADLAPRYVSRRDFHPAEERFYVWSYPASRRRSRASAS